jgi:hypothetical protein
MSFRERTRWLALAGFVVGSWFGINHEPRRTGIAADSAAVYAVVLSDLPRDAPRWEPVRLVEAAPAQATYMGRGDSDDPGDFGWLLRDLPGAERGSVAGFRDRLNDRTSLRGLLPRSRVWLVQPQGNSEPDSPLELAARHTFSHIGFNPERTQAIVYATYTCGSMCGSGHYVLLQRTGRRWRIVSTTMAWIS